MLEVEAVPQSCIPQVQIGWSIVLYMRRLLLQYIDNYLLHIRLYSTQKIK
jgi:hypothetical protein